MSREIIGGVFSLGLPKPNLNQTDPSKGDYVKGKDAYAKIEDIPTKPEDIGAQPAGSYLTEETDPTVPNWAKQPKKPTYTASEVGARSADWMPTAQEVGALPSTTVIPTVPTKVSAFTNDAGYLTEHQDISGKLDADKLPQAVDDALAQAKASGEFDGKNGDPGVSPTVAVSAITGGHRISITDQNGTKTVDVMDGAEGDPGDPGRGIKSIARTSGSGAAGTTDTYTITYTDNTTSTFTVRNGSNGAAGQAATLEITGVTALAPGAAPTITEASDSTAQARKYALAIPQGAPGKTPVRGTDYWTDEDQEAIVQQVITALGTPVFGRIESGNKIVLTGNVADGEYEYWFEDEEGKQSLIGTLNHTVVPEPAYTNMIPLSINTDGTDYVGDYGEDGYRTNYRIKSDFSEVSNTGTSITGHIPCGYEEKLYFYGMGLSGPINSGDTKVVLYDASFGNPASVQIRAIYAEKDKEQLISEGVTFDENGCLKTMTPKALRYWHSIDVVKNTAYVRFCSETITDESVITKNEPMA